jgi:hypothetical protein
MDLQAQVEFQFYERYFYTKRIYQKQLKEKKEKILQSFINPCLPSYCLAINPLPV